jgi:hypothetical protein
MIILTNTTDKIQVKLGGTASTNQLKCFASYRDTTTTSITPMRTAVATNNTTYVDLVGAPASSTQRIVDYISIQNTDTGSNNVSIVFNDNSTIYELFITNLAAGEKIEFQEGQGFKVLTNAGSVKTSVNQGNNTYSSGFSSVQLGSDVINSNITANTMADVTGLSFAVAANTSWYFKFVIRYDSAATTTGSRWSISGPATPISLCYMSEYSLTATTTTRNANVIGYDLPATSSASSGQITGNNAIIEGIIHASVDGTVIARFASEISGSPITAKAGSICFYQRLT